METKYSIRLINPNTEVSVSNPEPTGRWKLREYKDWLELFIEFMLPKNRVEYDTITTGFFTKKTIKIQRSVEELVPTWVSESNIYLVKETIYECGK